MDSTHTCPVWIGRLLTSPLRKLVQNPRDILAPHVRPGMTVSDVGCAMGYFSLPLARMIGADGHLICVDLQEGMLRPLRRRLRRAGLLGRCDIRLCGQDDIGLGDQGGRIDFILAFNMVHEAADPPALLRQFHAALKPDGRVLISEPRGHVSDGLFVETLAMAEDIGFSVVERPQIRGDRSVVFAKV